MNIFIRKYAGKVILLLNIRIILFMITPKYLKRNDKVAIVAPAGKVAKTVVNFAKTKLESWGLKVVLGKNVFQKHYQYAGTDEERLTDLQKAMDNESVKAILCARGGYGLIRLIDQLDFTKFQANPKWIIGFSDITILHSYIHTNFGIETLHAPMAAGLKDRASAETLQKVFFGKNLGYELPVHPLSKKGKAVGKIIGGNLAIICSLIGSVSGLDTKGKVLFFEDIGEYLYRLDRMMWTLKRTGKLDQLAGLVVGDFNDMKDNDSPFGKTAYEIIADAVAEYNYPVCFGFPAGHRKENKTIIFGRQVSLSINQNTTLNFKPKTSNSELRTSN
jgi:muramoyltetrapeptide carboxypeptidase